VQDDEQWQVLASMLGRPDWVADAGLATFAGRRARHDELDDGIAAWTRDQSPVEVVVALRLAGLPVAPVLAVPRMYDDPQLVARGYYQELDHPRTGRRRYPGWPAQFSFLDQHHRRGAPTLGQHNHEILTEDLALTDDDVDALARDGVIGDRVQAPG